MRYTEIMEGYNPEAVYLHGGPGPDQLEGGRLKRYMRFGGDSGALFFIADTPTGRKYALEYALTKPGNGGIWRVHLRIPKDQIFDFSNPKHVRLARRNLNPEEFASWTSSSRYGQLDWTAVDDEIMPEWGFRGALLAERPKGFNDFSEDAISVAVFDPNDVEIIDFVPKQDALHGLG